MFSIKFTISARPLWNVHFEASVHHCTCSSWVGQVCFAASTARSITELPFLLTPCTLLPLFSNVSTIFRCPCTTACIKAVLPSCLHVASTSAPRARQYNTLRYRFAAAAAISGVFPVNNLWKRPFSLPGTSFSLCFRPSLRTSAVFLLV